MADEPVFGDDERGLLDSIDELEDQLSEVTNYTHQLTEATTKIGELMKLRSDSLDKAGGTVTAQKNTQRIIDLMGRDMSEYAKTLNRLIAPFSTHLNESTSSIKDVSEMCVEISSNFDVDLQSKLKSTVGPFTESIGSALEKIEGMHDSVKKLPPMTRILSRGKNEVSRSLQSLTTVIRENHQKLVEINEMLN